MKFFPKTPSWQALWLMVGSTLSFACMSVLAKQVSREVSFFETVFYRSFVGAILIYVYARYRHSSLHIQNRKWLLVRSVFGTIAMVCVFYALSHAPLPEASALINLTPIMIAALGTLWLGEKISPTVAACLLLAAVGVVMIVRPGTPQASWGTLAAIGAAFTGAIAMVSLRKLGNSESPEGVVVHYLLFSSAATLLVGFRELHVPTPTQAALLFGTAFSGTLGQLLMTRAYSLESAARVAALGYMQVLWTFLFGVTFFHEIPDRYSTAGIGVLVLSGWLIIRAKVPPPPSSQVPLPGNSRV
jgi:drug/metabolite transporter (DMT)-like permease